ncbi:MAG: hypothetical protein Q4A74_04460 [Cardiobacteriaceae bacterium]|nr:hypothetical protein [Cardiobacteriaceae bacterium]
MLALRHTDAAQVVSKTLYEDECRFVDHRASLPCYADDEFIISEGTS